MTFGLSVTIVKLTDTLAYEELRNPNFGIKRAIGILLMKNSKIPILV
jgi:hypothetical protein